MQRRIALVLALTAALATACQKNKQGTAAPLPLTSDTFKDATGEIRIEVGYSPKPTREVEIVARMEAIGLDEMDKIVLDIKVDNFVVLEGNPEWTGFVAPRQPIKHQARFRLLDGTDQGTLTVTVRRSNDSELLYETLLPFVAKDDALAPDLPSS